MKKIAVIMNGLVFDSQRKILESIYRQSEEMQADIYTFTSQVLATNGRRVLEGAHQIFRLPDFSKFDGVILTPNTLTIEETKDWLFEELERTGIPAVNMDYQRKGIPCIMGDNYQGMHELVTHLITVHGIRRFCYLSGPVENRDSKLRKQAFFDGLNEHGIVIEEHQIFEGNFAPESGKKAIDYWRSQGVQLPEAIVCANDAMAQGVMIEIEKLGIKIPEEILVTGVDNSRFARESQPGMTSIERFYTQMGEQACELLKEMWQGKDISGKKVDIPSKMVVSESCGCDVVQNFDIEEYKREHMLNDFYNQEVTSVINAMMSDFSDCNSFRDVIEVLKEYVVWTDAEYFYLCMNDLKEIFFGNSQGELGAEGKEIDLTAGYSEYMTVPLAYEEGEFTSYGAYRSGAVLPKEVRRNGKPIRYIVIPLHYQNECFGYCVFGNSNFPVDRALCYTWILSITDAIQNVRKKLQLVETVRKLNDMWIYDTLTQVYNRAGFFHLSQELIEEAQKEKRKMFVLFIDLDGMKNVNDTLGHEAGDRYICLTASILKRVTEEHELIMRYGGDEFVIMGKFRDYNRAEELMQKIEAEIAVENRKEGNEVRLSASMGHEVFNPQDEENLQKVLERADQEMYKQKRRKKESELG